MINLPAKSFQSCTTLCNLMGVANQLLDPCDSSSKNTGVGCYFLLHDKPRQCIKKQRQHFASICPYSQSYGFSSSHVWMWEVDRKKSQLPKNWCLWTVVLEKTHASPLDWKEIQPVNPEGKQLWIFIGRIDAEAPVIWPPDSQKLTHWEKILLLGRIKGKSRGERRRADNEVAR